MEYKSYRKMRAEQQEAVSAILDKYSFFAFSNEQFYDGLRKFNLSDSPEDLAKLSRIYGGGYILKEHAAESVYDNVKESLKELRVRLQAYKKPEENKHDTIGKSESAKMWSNQYNVLSMWTKYRCVTKEEGAFDPMKENFTDEMLTELGKVEHNRWVVEQLLLRYRPLTDKEQKLCKVENLYASTLAKDEKKKNFAHLDICSNDKLDQIDYNISKLDKALIKVLPQAYREYHKTTDKQ